MHLHILTFLWFAFGAFLGIVLFLILIICFGWYFMTEDMDGPQ
jgi:hypothetical protein